MKEKILELRNQGKSYRQIEEELGCSKSTISFHCSQGGKERAKTRKKKLRNDNPLLKRTDNFRNRLHSKRNMFLKEEYIPKGSFSYKDILEKFGEMTSCYLTGEPIHLLSDQDYNLDHVIPRSRGGSNKLNNLGITTSIANQMKSTLLVEELLYWCQRILEHHGYTVTK